MRSHYCGQLDSSLLDQEIELYGWVHRRRDHGGVIFIDLRDREGLAQIVFDPDREEAFKIADSVRNEFVLKITGKVRKRPEGTINPDMPTGEVEVLGYTIEILNKAKTPPFQLDDEHVHVHDDIRLRYRYVDLRRPSMQSNLRLRSQVSRLMHEFLDEQAIRERNRCVLNAFASTQTVQQSIQIVINRDEFLLSNFAFRFQVVCTAVAKLL